MAVGKLAESGRKGKNTPTERSLQLSRRRGRTGVNKANPSKKNNWNMNGIELELRLGEEIRKLEFVAEEITRLILCDYLHI